MLLAAAIPQARAQQSPKSRFSQLLRQASCNQEDASRLKQRLDNEATPIVSESEALIFQHPGIAALDRPAARAEARSVRLTALVDPRFDAELPT